MIRRLWKTFLKFFSHIKVYPYPMFMIYCPEGYKLTASDMRTIFKKVEPGDVLLRGYVDYLDGYFIPGMFSHVGLYVGNDRVIHAMSGGVFEEDILTFCRCDYMGVVRPIAPASIKNEAIVKAYKCIGRPYDFGFDFNDHSSVCCTELIHCVYESVASELGIVPREQKVLFGLEKRYVISPDDFLMMRGMEIIFLSSYIAERQKEQS